jgi:hypothetical protein
VGFARKKKRVGGAVQIFSFSCSPFLMLSTPVWWWWLDANRCRRANRDTRHAGAREVEGEGKKKEKKKKKKKNTKRVFVLVLAVK